MLTVSSTVAQEFNYPDSLTVQKNRKQDKDTIFSRDSLIFKSDSLHLPGNLLPGSTVKKEKKFLDSKVKYTARDSMRFDLKTKKMFLYGEAHVDYESITLKAGYMELDMNSKIVYAKGILDSLGKETEQPVFEDKGHSFASKEMTFNFETKKGLIKEVITKEGEGYIHGENVKKMQNDELYIKNGKYTTCENPQPHFHIHASKLKVIPDDKIITGPAYLAVEDVPTPLALPFGFFPNKKGQTSGLIIPTYGESEQLGFFLNNGGYYFALSEKADLSLLGDIYSKGSWALGANSNYHKRYKFTGKVDARYSNIILGESRLRDYRDEKGKNPFFQENKGFMIKWQHTQDLKARPNSRFSADVNAGTSDYNRLNSFGSNSASFLTNTLQSNISYSRSWPGKPFNLTLNGRHSQNTITKEVSVTLPEATFTVNRFFPFKRQASIGAPKWYEKIGVTYSTNTKNVLNAYDTLLFDKSSLQQFRNGMMHNASASTSFKMLKYFTLTPNFSYNERWYLQTIQKRFDTETDTLVTDTMNGFRRVEEYSFSANLTTTLYGMYQFRKGPVQAIRHVFTPSIRLSYRPDFSTQQYGYYGQEGLISSYSPYDIGIYGKPVPAQQGLINFNFINNLEMKVRSAKDTITGFKKIKILENLTVDASHNVLAEEFKWTPVRFSGRTTLFNNFNVNFGTTMSPYALSKDSLPAIINVYEWDYNKKIGRFVDAKLDFNFNLRSKQGAGPITSSKGTEEELQMIMNNPNAYVDFNIPWNVSISYVFMYSRPLLESVFTQSLQFNGDFNLTPKWKFGFSSGYDFVSKDLTYTSLNIYRDLHCWEMSFNWVPFGFNKSYNLQINAKSAILQDLKLTRRRSPWDLRQL